MKSFFHQIVIFSQNATASRNNSVLSSPSIQHLIQRKCGTLRMGVLIVLCALSIGLMQPSAAPVEAPVLTLSGMTVALDPGHGGYDGGARARDSGIWEKEITLQIALAAEKALTERGATVILTRRTDEDFAKEDLTGKARKRSDLQKRLDLAEEAGADVFLSIHLNEYRSRAESGPQVFYQRGADAGRLLAGALQESLIQTLRPSKERKAMAGDYYVLRGPLPAALVECGFLSNAQEEKSLLDPAYQRRIAEAIAGGLETYASLREKV